MTCWGAALRRVNVNRLPSEKVPESRTAPSKGVPSRSPLMSNARRSRLSHCRFRQVDMIRNGVGPV
jgi:hypothetical protein